MQRFSLPYLGKNVKNQVTRISQQSSLSGLANQHNFLIFGETFPFSGHH